MQTFKYKLQEVTFIIENDKFLEQKIGKDQLFIINIDDILTHVINLFFIYNS